MRLLDGIINKALFQFYNLFEPKPKPSEPATPQLVAKRFRQLFKDHGIEETQIPRVFPKITLDDLKSDDSLLKKLTTELLNEVADLFKVRLEWLEGVGDAIYDYQSCYQQPEKFFEFLKTLQYGEWDFPFRVITPVKNFDYKDASHQPFSILYVEKIAELGDEDIHRYYLDAGWSWNHWKCRIQLKALALLYWQKARHPITFYTVPLDVYLQIEDHQQIPYQHLRGGLISNPSVEDYISDPNDSVVAKEFDEMADVHKYIDEHKLSEMNVYRSTIGSDSHEDSIPEYQHDLSKAISEMNSRNAKFRYESSDNLKFEFKHFFESNNYQNKSQAARDYFNGLTLDNKKLVVPTYYEKDHKNGVEKAVRNLTKALTT